MVTPEIDRGMTDLKEQFLNKVRVDGKGVIDTRMELGVTQDELAQWLEDDPQFRKKIINTWLFRNIEYVLKWDAEIKKAHAEGRALTPEEEQAASDAMYLGQALLESGDNLVATNE